MNQHHEEKCFHCGLPVPQGSHYPVTINGEEHNMCCPGCQAVAKAIVDSNLTSFYEYRTEVSPTARGLVPEALQEMQIYNKPELQSSFVTVDEKNIKQASLILEGIVCAACVWLNERHINAMPGVVEFRVNYSTHRARVRWDDSQLQLSDILQAITAIGYVAHPFDPGRQEEIYKKERSKALKRLAIAGLGATQVMMLAVALYAGDYSGMDAGLENFMRWVSMIIATPVVFYSARSFFSSAWRDLKVKQLGMDVPVSLAIGMAYIASCWATVTRSGEVYFDSVTMFTFFLLAGRFLEMGARQKAGQAAEELVKLLPAMATRLSDQGDQQVAVSELVVGDRVRVKPGDSIPADGVVIEGLSSIDESLLTGESIPLAKTVDAQVVGGTVNIESPLVIRVEKVGEDTVLAEIQRLLDRAQVEKPSIARMADRVAAYFVGFLLVLASAVGYAWYQVNPDQAFWVVISLLVVTCPCALSLATPAAMTAATGTLTRLGVLTTRGHALETLAKVTHVVLDKTGTLTEGRLALESTQRFAELSEDECINIAAALELGSEHPVARVFHDLADNNKKPEAKNIEAIPGKGVSGLVNQHQYRLGSEAFVADVLEKSSYKQDSTRYSTEIFLATAENLVAVFYLSDILRAEAAESVERLKAMGKKVWLVSGDNESAVNYVARQTGITDVCHSMQPEDKLKVINQLQQQGAIVAMIGDGVNDAPVLAAAQVSIAMGGGTQLAQASADMVLLSEHLPHLVEAHEMANRSLKIIKQNLGWALGYNLVALPLASLGYVAPWMAAIGMSASSLVVVVNALRLNSMEAIDRQKQHKQATEAAQDSV